MCDFLPQYIPSHKTFSLRFDPNHNTNPNPHPDPNLNTNPNPNSAVAATFLKMKELEMNCPVPFQRQLVLMNKLRLEPWLGLLESWDLWDRRYCTIEYEQQTKLQLFATCTISNKVDIDFLTF